MPGRPDRLSIRLATPQRASHGVRNASSASGTPIAVLLGLPAPSPFTRLPSFRPCRRPTAPSRSSPAVARVAVFANRVRRPDRPSAVRRAGRRVARRRCGAWRHSGRPKSDSQTIGSPASEAATCVGESSSGTPARASMMRWTRNCCSASRRLKSSCRRYLRAAGPPARSARSAASRLAKESSSSCSTSVAQWARADVGSSRAPSNRCSSTVETISAKFQSRRSMASRGNRCCSHCFGWAIASRQRSAARNTCLPVAAADGQGGLFLERLLEFDGDDRRLLARLAADADALPAEPLRLNVRRSSRVVRS